MKKNNFIEGAFIATMAIFITKFIGIIYVIPFHRIIGIEGGALYGYAYNIYNLFLIISAAGIPLAISKLTSEYNTLNKHAEKKYLYEVSTKIIFIFSLISFLICFIFSNQIATLIIGNMTGGNTISDVSYVIKAVSFAILIVPMLSISRGYLQGHKYMTPPALSQIIEQIIRVLIVLGGSFLTLRVFNLELKNAIGISVFAAAIGAFIAYFYLISKLRKIKTEESDIKLEKSDKLIIIKKIIEYSIPFIIINIANSLYTTIDMILVIRGLNILNFNPVDIETISSVFTTWGTKINTIITSIATGVALSLIPNITSERAKNNKEEINNKFNKTIEAFFYVVLPLALFMSIFATQIWQIFYGENFFGQVIVKYSVIVAAVDALYIMISNALQGLNKTKLIYLSVILGLAINAILDIPLILLFNKLNIYPYYGAITATLIGYLISIFIPIIVLKKQEDFKYNNTLKNLPKLFISYSILILICIIYKCFIDNITNRIILVILLSIIGIICLILYYLLNKNIFGDIIKKIRIKRSKK